MYDIDPNQTAQACAYAEAALLAARKKGISPEGRYQAAEDDLRRLQRQAWDEAVATTDYGRALTLADRLLTIQLAIIDLQGRRAAFLKGKVFAEDRLRAQGVH